MRQTPAPSQRKRGLRSYLGANLCLEFSIYILGGMLTAALLCEFPKALSSWKFPSVLSSCRVMTLPTGQAQPRPSAQPGFVPRLPMFCLPCCHLQATPQPKVPLHWPSWASCLASVQSPRLPSFSAPPHLAPRHGGRSSFSYE